MNDTGPLSEIVHLSSEKVAENKDPSKPYVGLEHISSGEMRLRTLGLAATSISTNNVFRAGDTLFGKLRPQLRKCVRASCAGYCSTDILVLRPNEGFSSEFASYTLASEAVFAEAIRVEEGTKMPRCSWKDLKKKIVFCPSPLQQRKIARILTTLDNLIEKTEALIAKYQAIKQGMMHDLFTRGVDSSGQLRPTQEQAPDLYKQSELGWIPKDCSVKALKEVAERVVVGLALSTTHAYRERGVALIRNQNIRKGFFEDDDMLFLDPHFASLYPNKAARKGDVLTVRTGANVGDTALVPDKYVGCPTFTTLITSPDTSVLNPKYLVHYIVSKFGVFELNRLLVGGGKENLNVGEFVKLRVVLPPVESQTLFVRALTTLENRLDVERVLLQKYKRQKTGLMQDLLTGKVRVRVEEAEEVDQ